MKKIKINLLDVFVLIIVVALVFASIIKFRNYNEENNENSKIDKFTYQLKISGVREYTIDAFSSGDIIYDSQSNVEIGKIVGKTYTNSKGYEQTENGKVVSLEYPDKYDLLLQVETDGIINESGYYANKTVELKVGSEKAIESLYAQTNARITNIQVSGENSK